VPSKYHYDEEFCRQVVGLYRSGLSQGAVGRLLGVSENIVYRVLNLKGEARRNRKESQRLYRERVTQEHGKFVSKRLAPLGERV
jgi:hypothetical protein